MKNKIILFLLADIFLFMAAGAPLTASAQNSIGDRDGALREMSTKGWEFELKAGLNIGGATPLSFPFDKTYQQL